MACYRPISAFRTDSGEIVFGGKLTGAAEPLTLPCGQCIGCRLDRSRQWATRIMLESQSHDSNSFITLTFNEEHCPYPPSLHYPDFQLFMKRLRKRVGAVRFFVAGEYGDELRRPHYHAIIFGYGFPDRVFLKRSGSGQNLYTSKLLESLWTFGYSSVAEVTFQSAAYVARYCLKKINGDQAEYHYAFVDPSTGEVSYIEPEFAHMSLKPGIGSDWFYKYKDTDLSRDFVVIDGRRQKPPRYFDVLFDRLDPLAFDQIKADRAFLYSQRSRDNPGENFDARLRVREEAVSRRIHNLLPRGDL